jgi:hypothetical protein
MSTSSNWDPHHESSIPGEFTFHYAIHNPRAKKEQLIDTIPDVLNKFYDKEENFECN